MLRNSLLVLSLVFVSDVAFACQPQDSFINIPRTTRADCSFINADTDDGKYNRDKLSGGKAFDRGDGKVAQRITYLAQCSTIEILVFTECSTGASIEINGIVADDFSEYINFTAEVKYIQPPFGPIRADASDTVESLRRQAAEAGLSGLVRGSAENTGEMFGGLWDRYDSNCGCALFYPDSVGAELK